MDLWETSYKFIRIPALHTDGIGSTFCLSRNPKPNHRKLHVGTFVKRQSQVIDTYYLVASESLYIGILAASITLPY